MGLRPWRLLRTVHVRFRKDVQTARNEFYSSTVISSIARNGTIFLGIGSPALVVSTAASASAQMVEQARGLAFELDAAFIPRDKRSIEAALADSGAQRLLVVENDALCLRDALGFTYRFHPNMVLVRAMNLARHGRDAFLDAAELAQGEHVLDCTLGFACEATLASYAVGESGEVIGLEAVPELAAVTRAGVAKFPISQARLCAAMRRIVVLTANYRDYLKSASDRSRDLVYFDPFFIQPLTGSEHNIGPLAHFGNRDAVDPESLKHARRVARRRVLIKHARFVPLDVDLANGRSHVVTSNKGSVAYSVYDPE